jgi:sugar phosphate isomerase/epimerase
MMKLGVMVYLSKNVYEDFRKVHEMGFSTCQLCCWEESMFTEEYSKLVTKASSDNNIEISAFWCGWQGPKVWDFYSGPVTLGLVPQAYRFARMETLVRGADFAKRIGVVDVVTHVGYIPENPNDSDYKGVLEAVKYVAEHCKNNGQFFLFETGQETPITLKRLIEDIGLDNLAINLDPANLLLYGKANPVDSLDIFGEYVRGVHAKDGDYPTNGKYLGEEKPLGEGRVNFEALIAKLKKLGYKGALTIEREISGEQQIKDILRGKKFLEEIINRA